jgi:DNA-binding LytR/AlgR family response regulator
MKVLIADDEPIARQVLRELLDEMPGTEVLGEAADGLAAVEMTARLKPDVIFLDLQMPGLDGFAVARALRGGRLPVVVYVTAFDAHALEAFDTGAIDYLLKPVRAERLAAALDKVRAHLPREQPPAWKKIAGRSGASVHLLDPADVIAFQAEGEVVYIHTAKQRYYCDHALRVLEQRLPAEHFRRIHRGTIINTDHIRTIAPLSSKRWLLRMSNGMEAVVSKRLASFFRDEIR